SGNFFFRAPYYTLSVPAPADVVALVVFTGVAVLVGWLGTARTRAAALAAASRRRMVDTLESISEGFVALDRRWRFTELNPRAEELLGRTRDDLLGRSIAEAFPDARGTSVFEQATAALHAERASKFEAFCASRDLWFSVQLHPIARGFYVYFEDVTGR